MDQLSGLVELEGDKVALKSKHNCPFHFAAATKRANRAHDIRVLVSTVIVFERHCVAA